MSTLTQQLYSQSHWLADGSQTVWNFSFSGGYISRDHVKAYTRGPLDDDPRVDLALTPDNFIGDFQIIIEPAVIADHTLVIYRDTPKDLPLVDFIDGANINEVSLDTVAKQAVFVAAESADFLGVTTTADLAELAATAIANAGAAAASAVNASASANAAGTQAGNATLSASNAAVSAVAAASSAANASAAVSSAISTVLANLNSAASSVTGSGMVADNAAVAYVAGSVGFALRQIRERQGVNLLDYVTPQTVAERENVRTGVSAMDSAWAAAATASYLRNNATIHLCHGAYRATGELLLTQGTMVMAEGSQGSNQAYGTSITHESNGDCFVWTGSGTAFAGTGGGLFNVLILKADTYQGGSAVRLTATSDNHRPGEMVLGNVLAYGTGSTPGAGGNGGLWARPFLVDGSACNTPGARGVRTVVMYKCRFAEGTVANETVVLNQVTHFYSDGLAIDTGDAVAAQGLTIKGICDGVYMTNSAIGGNVLITANDANNQLNNFHFHGKIAGTFTNNDTQVNGILTASFDTAGLYVLNNRSKQLKCLTNINTVFTLVNTTTDSNILGGAAGIVDIAWDTEQLDQGNNITVPVTTFTCTCAGNYKFSACVLLADVVVGHNRADIYITQAGSVSRSYNVLINPGAVAAGGYVSLRIDSPVMSLAYGDTVRIRGSVAGGTQVVDIFGDPTLSWFSGYYIPS